tara:strand:- start:1145 stop:2701 length:1557 start_codon:yes stop_codon:yes gene_type:complete
VQCNTKGFPLIQNQHTKRSRRLNLTTLCCCVLGSIGLLSSSASHALDYSNDDALPLLGDPVSAIVSPEDEIVLGRAYQRALRNQMPIILDPTLNNYLRDLIRRIVAASNGELPPIHLSLINSSAINAFAVPGGILGVNAGLFLYSTTEAELAAVFAHELAHLSQRHYARGIEHREKTKWATYTGILASLALLATSDSSTGIASILATQAVTLDAHLQFSRQNEREADRVGMESLYTAGFDPRAMPAFFGRLLQSKQFSGTEDYEFLNTHPVTKSRISDSQARADQLSQQITPMRLSEVFQFMQARIGAAYASTPQEAVAQYTTKLKSKPNNPIYRYGLARAYIRNQEFDDAIAIVREADFYTNPKSEELTQYLEFALVEIEALIEKQDFSTAEKRITALFEVFPNHIPLQYYQAKTALGLGHYSQATMVLNRLLDKDDENLLYLEQLLISYRDQYDQLNTLVTQARISFARGAYGKASEHYRQALRLTDSSNLPLQAKLQQKLREIALLQQKLKEFSQ